MIKTSLPSEAEIDVNNPRIPRVASLPCFDLSVIQKKINTLIEECYPELEALYVDIHRHPELAFQEIRTAALLAKTMRLMGFEVTEQIAITGIVAIYKNGEGPTVLVRTELDALPMEEKTGLAYASCARQTLDEKLTYVAHSCGHDVHMAWWVGTARVLLAMKEEWSGTLMFIAQPAEEIVSGAKAMLADGLFSRFPKADYGFAAHITPAPTRTVFIKDGALTSTSDAISIVFNGCGAHGSMPEKGLDPVVMGSRFVMDVQSVVSRDKDPQAFGIITVGSFHAGAIGNIIPEKAELRLSVRSHDPKTRQVLLDGIERTAKASAIIGRAPDPTITYLHGTGVLYNDSALAARVNVVMKSAFGPKFTFIPSSASPGTASEDFSEYVEAGVPSVYFGIGGIDPKLWAEAKSGGMPVPVNHSPYFAPTPAPSISMGVEVLTLAVLMVMTREQ